MIRARNHYYYPRSNEDYAGKQSRIAKENMMRNSDPQSVEPVKKKGEELEKKVEEKDDIFRWWSRLTAKKEKKKVLVDKLPEKVATLSIYSKIVKWLNDALTPGDTRSYNPNPMFSFACKYDLLEKEPAEIYNEYVSYQCIVYAEADERLSARTINETPFAELQIWYETLREESRDVLEAKDWTCY